MRSCKGISVLLFSNPFFSSKLFKSPTKSIIGSLENLDRSGTIDPTVGGSYFENNNLTLLRFLSSGSSPNISGYLAGINVRTPNSPWLIPRVVPIPDLPRMPYMGPDRLKLSNFVWVKFNGSSHNIGYFSVHLFGIFFGQRFHSISNFFEYFRLVSQHASDCRDGFEVFRRNFDGGNSSLRNFCQFPT